MQLETPHFPKEVQAFTLTPTVTLSHATLVSLKNSVVFHPVQMGILVMMLLHPNWVAKPDHLALLLSPVTHSNALMAPFLLPVPLSRRKNGRRRGWTLRYSVVL
ncbi:uncharacterized protein LOC124141072 isoform X3 [Haliotis rufescens]|uniref:uncharacterized protein LOC124141072 isoform X3 n=1 Tax=Haliotis rufescens TaxID=6454 RepID=UPI00201EAF72|nr:uncharacterized protein LOC124141072 isoform X3 [Haliotis rufescens]